MFKMADFKNAENEYFRKYYTNYYTESLDNLKVIIVSAEDRLHIDAFSITGSCIFCDPILIEQFQLTEIECFSCIAHEVGHYMSPPMEELSNRIDRELYADKNAINLGLAAHLITALNKMCPEEEITKLRIEVLKKGV